jgi:gliding motility-associated lipoprotein GldD
MLTLLFKKPTLLMLSIAGLLLSCNSVYTPKPRGYYKIDLPAHQYQAFNKTGYPYLFEYPTYGQATQDSAFFEEQPENPYWLNIDFPTLHAKIYISYMAIGGRSRYKVQKGNGEYVDSLGVNTFENLIKGSYTLTYKHSYKASSIEDSLFTNPQGIEGIYFKVGGNTATAQQFLLTDSVKHFLRGALYFDAAPNEDSVSIVSRFLQEDIKHLINTFRFK